MQQPGAGGGGRLTQHSPRAQPANRTQESALNVTGKAKAKAVTLGALVAGRADGCGLVQSAGGVRTTPFGVSLLLLVQTGILHHIDTRPCSGYSNLATLLRPEIIIPVILLAMRFNTRLSIFLPVEKENSHVQHRLIRLSINSVFCRQFPVIDLLRKNL